MKNETKKGQEIRKQILDLVNDYYNTEHIRPEYKEGDPIPYGGRIYDEKELQNLDDYTGACRSNA